MERPQRDVRQPCKLLYAGKGSADLLPNITSNCKFVGFDVLPDFGVWNIFKNLHLSQAVDDYKQHLVRYCS